MNVSLTPELEAFVQREVESGQYASHSEVMRDGLRLLQREQELLQVYIQQGLKSRRIPAGEVTLDAVVDRAKRKAAKQLAEA